MSRAPALRRTSPSLVGREDELAQISALLGTGGVLTLIGEAGLGKTRLASEALTLARSLGWVAIEGRASSEDAELPLAPVRDALRAARRSLEMPVPADPLAAAFPGMVLPELRGGSADEPGRDVIFEAAARWSAAIGCHGLLLVLEDLHWADPTTHKLVPRLARSLAGEKVALLLTFRAHEAEEGGTLDEMRRELARERLGAEIELEPLEPAAVDALLRELLGVELEPAVARLFAQATGGNPFVTEELVRAAVEVGRLDPEEGVWRGADTVELSWTVTEMVLARLRRLEDGDQELARWAAVAGERFDPELLRATGALSEEQLLAGLSRLRAAGILRDERDGAMAFRHALTHQAVLGTLVGPDRRRRHAALLEAGEARAGSGSEVPLDVLLGYALGCGRRAEAFRYARLAAKRSLELVERQATFTVFARRTTWRSFGSSTWALRQAM
jgi:predicted ATPase